MAATTEINCISRKKKRALIKVSSEEAERREQMSRIRSRPSTSTDWLTLACKYIMADT